MQDRSIVWQLAFHCAHLSWDRARWLRSLLERRRHLSANAPQQHRRSHPSFCSVTSLTCFAAVSPALSAHILLASLAGTRSVWSVNYGTVNSGACKRKFIPPQQQRPLHRHLTPLTLTSPAWRCVCTVLCAQVYESQMHSPQTPSRHKARLPCLVAKCAGRAHNNPQLKVVLQEQTYVQALFVFINLFYAFDKPPV